MAQARYVRCQVSPGFFGDEFYVVIDRTSAYVNRSNVRVETEPARGADVEGYVLAYFITEEEDRGILVELPGEPVVGGLLTWVTKAQLQAA